MQYDAKRMIQQIGAALMCRAARDTELRDYPAMCAKAKAQRKKAPCPKAHATRLATIPAV